MTQKFSPTPRRAGAPQQAVPGSNCGLEHPLQSSCKAPRCTIGLVFVVTLLIFQDAGALLHRGGPLDVDLNSRTAMHTVDRTGANYESKEIYGPGFPGDDIFQAATNSLPAADATGIVARARLDVRGPRVDDAVVRACCSIDFHLPIVAEADGRNLGHLRGYTRADIVMTHIDLGSTAIARPGTHMPSPEEVSPSGLEPHVLADMRSILPAVTACARARIHAHNAGIDTSAKLPDCLEVQARLGAARVGEAFTAFAARAQLPGGPVMHLHVPAHEWVPSLMHVRITALDDNGVSSPRLKYRVNGTHTVLLEPTFVETTFMLLPTPIVAVTNETRREALSTLELPPLRQRQQDALERPFGYLILSYSDDYANAAMVAAKSLLESEGLEALDDGAALVIHLAFLVGCRMTAANDTSVQLEAGDLLLDLGGRLHDRSAAAPFKCVSTVSQRMLARMRSMSKLVFQESAATPPRAVLRPRMIFVPFLDFLPGIPAIGLDAGVWMKLHAWALDTLFSCFVMIDADTLVLRPLSGLFMTSVCSDDQSSRQKLIAAVVSGKNLEERGDEGFNVGLIVSRPDRRLWRDMLQHASYHNKFQVVETSFLNLYFGTRRLLLPENFWCIAEDANEVSLAARHAQPCFTVDFSSCGAARFKPWQNRRPPTQPGQYCRQPASRVYNEWVERWRAANHQLDAILRT